LLNKYEALAFKAAEQPKTTTHIRNTKNVLNRYENMPPFSDLTPEYVQEVFDDFDRSHLIDGQKGVARFTFNKMLKDPEGNLYMECSDPSRHVYRFKDEHGNIVRDLKAKHLTSLIAEPVKNKSLAIMEEIDNPELCERLVNAFLNIKGIRRDNGDFCSELSYLTSNELILI
jgi:hypothetical protein